MTTVTVPAHSLFGPENLPYGVFSVAGSDRRVGTRLGDTVIDLAVLLGDEVFARPTLNAFMAQGHDRWIAVRREIAERVAGEIPDEAVHAVDDVTLHMPIEVADYVDFYASEHHAANLGRLFRPDAPDPLTPNWKHMPISYHGRAGSIVVSGTDIVRPCGQRRGADDPAPVFGPSVRLDIEAELGFVVGSGSAMGECVPVEEAARHIFGVVLFNDWSARDIQAWEYVPLGRTSASRSPRRSRPGWCRCWRCRRPWSPLRSRTRDRCRTWRWRPRGGWTSTCRCGGTATRSVARPTVRCTGRRRRCWRT